MTKQEELQQKLVSSFTEGIVTFAKEAGLSEEDLAKLASHVMEKLGEASEHDKNKQ